MLRLVARGALFTLFVVSSTVLLGLASNTLSRSSCERYAALEIAKHVTHPELGVLPLYLLPNASPDSERILRKAGLTTQPCNRNLDHTFDCFPWGDVARAQYVAPYVMKVRWEYVVMPTSGAGTETRFVCIFGFAWPLSERGLWVA